MSSDCLVDIAGEQTTSGSMVSNAQKKADHQHTPLSCIFLRGLSAIGQTVQC